MGIFALGVNFGLLIAYLGGGWMSEHWGWRTTFIVVGLPGLLIALLVRFTMVEPARGATEPKRLEAHAQPPPFWRVARQMWRTPATRHVVLGSALAGFGAIGTFTAGRMADVLARRDPRWLTWIVAVGKGGLVPFLVLFFLMDDLLPALLIYLVPAFFGGFYLAPTFAMIQGLVPVHMRSVAAAICLFLLNLIGMGLGPQGVVILSDYLHAEYGQESLRYSLMIFSLVNLWCAWHYFLAGRTLDGDMARQLSAALPNR